MLPPMPPDHEDSEAANTRAITSSSDSFEEEAIYHDAPSSSSDSMLQKNNESTPQSSSSSTSDSLTFLTEICGALKRIKRTGWVMRQIPLPESDSDHMHRCAMCAMLVTTQPADDRDDYTLPEAAKFHPAKVNCSKLLRMAVTHDLCEALAGDITPFCDPSVVASKYDKEEKAMEAIRKVVGDPLGLELFELWREYEAQDTVEALYCKDIDKFEMVLQAFEYEKEHLKSRDEVGVDDARKDTVAEGGNTLPDVFTEPLRRFFVTTNDVLKSPLFRRLDEELRDRREEMLKGRGWEVTEDERQQY